MPQASTVFEFASRDDRGYSVSYEVIDPAKLAWSVKIGVEAQSEVATSRIVWALGYHQPPIYLLPRWNLRRGDGVEEQPAGRFRPKEPVLDPQGPWAWRQNPFVNTQPYRGLLVLMLLVNSTDLKDENNEVYDQTLLPSAPRRWFVVKDLGATLGETGRLYPRRNDIEAFERHGFVKGVEGGRVRFAYRGRHQGLFEQVRPADVRWLCERASRLTDDQLRDAFRAAAYDALMADRFVKALRQRIEEGRSLREPSR